MISGNDALARIDAAVRELRAEEEAVAAAIRQDRDEIVELNDRLAAAFSALAEFRLDELARAPVGEALDRTARQVRDLLKGRDAELDRIAEEAAALDRDLAKLQADRQALAGAIEAAEKELEDAESELREKLAGDSEYSGSLADAEAARATAQEAARKAETALNDRNEKGRPYEADSLFMYLWRRGYGTAAYRSRGIVRSLDGWVARLIGFTEARANYYMLLQLPERLGEHAERLKAAAEAAEGALEAVWRARAGKAGLTRRRDLLEEKRAALAGMDEAIAAAHDQRSDVEAARERVMKDEGGGRAAALSLIQEQLRSTRIAELRRRAMLTPMPEDEELVETINAVARRIDEEEGQVSEREKILSDLARRRAEMETLRSRFVRDGYAQGGSFFEGNDFLKLLLAGLLRGALSSGGAWDEIRRHHRPSRGSRASFPCPGGRSSGPVLRMPSRPRGPAGGGRSGGFRTGGGF